MRICNQISCKFVSIESTQMWYVDDSGRFHRIAKFAILFLRAHNCLFHAKLELFILYICTFDDTRGRSYWFPVWDIWRTKDQNLNTSRTGHHRFEVYNCKDWLHHMKTCATTMMLWYLHWRICQVGTIDDAGFPGCVFPFCFNGCYEISPRFGLFRTCWLRFVVVAVFNVV